MGKHQVGIQPIIQSDDSINHATNILLLTPKFQELAPWVFSSSELERWVNLRLPPLFFSQMRKWQPRGAMRFAPNDPLNCIVGGETGHHPMPSPGLSPSLLPSFHQVLRENLQSACSNLKEITPALLAWITNSLEPGGSPVGEEGLSPHLPRFGSWAFEINR